jgi:hypothetical protein
VKKDLRSAKWKGIESISKECEWRKRGKGKFNKIEREGKKE